MAAEIAIVVAMDEKRGIGKDGKIPWRIPEDVKRFKDETIGHPVIMGRKTYESIKPKYRPLVDRTNIVMTRNQGLEIPGCVMVHSVEEAIDTALNLDSVRVCVIGGAEIYLAAMPRVDRLYLTHVEGDFDCDTFFPEYEDEFPYQDQVLGSSYEGIKYIFEELTRTP